MNLRRSRKPTPIKAGDGEGNTLSKETNKESGWTQVTRKKKARPQISKELPIIENLENSTTAISTDQTCISNRLSSYELAFSKEGHMKNGSKNKGDGEIIEPGVLREIRNPACKIIAKESAHSKRKPVRTILNRSSNNEDITNHNQAQVSMAPEGANWDRVTEVPNNNDAGGNNVVKGMEGTSGNNDRSSSNEHSGCQNANSDHDQHNVLEC